MIVHTEVQILLPSSTSEGIFKTPNNVVQKVNVLD